MSIQNKPLVSVGLPSYNRPEGLKKALDSVLKQTYKNLDIIVSDNCSHENMGIQAVIDGYRKNDNRIRFFQQTKNEGAYFNFKFVLEKAEGEFFMWAADDDYFESDDIIERLVAELSSSAGVALAFSDFNVEDHSGRLRKHTLFDKYSKCKTPEDYIKSLCSSGVGNPVYGLYRKSILTSELMTLNDNDLAYFNEGIFLHTFFLDFNVKFVPGIYIRYFSSNIFDKIRKTVIVKDFIKYSFRLIRLYGRSKLNFKMKIYCMSFLILKHSFNTFRFMLK